MSSSANTQDWETVVFHKKKSSTKKDVVLESVINKTPIEYKQKFDAGKNKQHISDATNKFDGDEIPKLKKVSTSLKSNLQSARQAKGWTQKELAQRINEKQTVVAQYESGQAIPNNAIINKLERALGTRIRESAQK